jgi:hypothetical protein
VLKNSLTRLLTLPPRPASLSVDTGAISAVVYRVAGPNRVPAALSKTLNGSPDWRVTIVVLAGSRSHSFGLLLWTYEHLSSDGSSEILYVPKNSHGHPSFYRAVVASQCT